MKLVSTCLFCSMYCVMITHCCVYCALRADAAKEVSTIFMTSVDNAVHQPLSTDSSHCAFEDNSSSSTLRTDTADRQPCHTTVSNKGTVQENLPGGTTVNRPFEGIEMSTIETAISQVINFCVCERP